MPVQEPRKRKYDFNDSQALRLPKHRKLTSYDASELNKLVNEIQCLEQEILLSQKNYNKLAQLFDYSRNGRGLVPVRRAALIALCNIFSEFMVLGKLQTNFRKEDNKDSIIIKWLSERCEQFCTSLLDNLGEESIFEMELTCKILMQLVKAEATSSQASQGQAWTEGLYPGIITRLLRADCKDSLLESFVANYIQPFNDVRFYTFRCVRYEYSMI